MDDQGRYIDRDGNVTAGPPQDPNIHKVAGPAVLAPLAPKGAILAIGALAAAGMITAEQKKTFEADIEQGAGAFLAYLEDAAKTNPMIETLMILAREHENRHQRTDVADPPSPLGGYPADLPQFDGAEKQENIPATFDAETPSSQEQKLVGPQIEVFPDQSDDDIGGPTILDMEKSDDPGLKNDRPGPTKDYHKTPLQRLPKTSVTKDAISTDDFDKLGESGYLDPNRIHTMQDSVSSKFTKNDDGSVQMPLIETVNQLINDPEYAKEIPAVRIAVINGKVFTLDHRRLVAGRLVGVKIKYRKAREVEIRKAIEDKDGTKLTTNDNGKSIRINDTKNKRNN